VVLPQDSWLLGRASRSTHDVAADSLEGRLSPRVPDKTAEFSGDLGMLGLLDRHEPTTTRIVMRPEWVAETGANVEADVARAKEPHNADQWNGQVPEGAKAEVDTITGSRLKVTPTTIDGKPAVFYEVENGGSTMKTQDYISYLPCEPTDTRPMCAAFRK